MAGVGGERCVRGIYVYSLLNPWEWMGQERERERWNEARDGENPL
jgi:hypothetical protein